MMASPSEETVSLNQEEHSSKSNDELKRENENSNEQAKNPMGLSTVANNKQELISSCSTSGDSSVVSESTIHDNGRASSTLGGTKGKPLLYQF